MANTKSTPSHPWKGPFRHTLLILFVSYLIASLIHFIHNAEFLAQYPNLPESWTKNGVYLAWLGMTAIGIIGWFVHKFGFRKTGLTILGFYACLGLDSLAHYVVASIHAHTIWMNVTILLEVTTAALLLTCVIWMLIRRPPIGYEQSMN